MAAVMKIVQELVIAALKLNPKGLSRKGLEQFVQSKDPKVNALTIRDAISRLRQSEPELITETQPGYFVLSRTTSDKQRISSSDKEVIRKAITEELAIRKPGLAGKDLVNAIAARFSNLSRRSVAMVIVGSAMGTHAITVRDSSGVYKLASGSAISIGLTGKNANSIKSAIAIELKAHPKGITGRELVRAVEGQFPVLSRRKIAANLYGIASGPHAFAVRDSNNVYRLLGTKPQRQLVNSQSEQGHTPSPQPDRSATQRLLQQSRIAEKEFYEPFRQWLAGKPENCKTAIVVGGKPFSLKWSSPDVMGVRRTSGVHKFDLSEIISAEIKLEARNVIEAFGQACSYRLFSHKSYVVIPNDAADQEERLDSLCMLFGIGMVVFQRDPKQPNFQIRVRAARGEVDIFELNRILAEKIDGKNTIADQLF